MMFFKILTALLLLQASTVFAFTARSLSPTVGACRQQRSAITVMAARAEVTEQEAKKGIDKVVAALRRDSTTKSELGNLDKVTVVLGYGSPTGQVLNVRFNASFRKAGKGLSSIPLPFGLGQSNESEGRGTMVGQVKASVDSKTGKVVSCTVFRDLGYGRSFNLKV